MKKRKSLIIALCIIIPLLTLLSCCTYITIDLLSGLYNWTPVMVAVENNIKALLDENNFSYTRNYTEHDSTQTAEYIITEGEAKATLIVSYDSSSYSIPFEFTITDPTKNFDQKIYNTLDLVYKLTYYSLYNVETMVKDEYLYSQTNEVTIYRHNRINESEYYFEVTLREDYYSIYIFENAAEDYFYA